MSFCLIIMQNLTISERLITIVFIINEINISDTELDITYARVLSSPEHTYFD